MHEKKPCLRCKRKIDAYAKLCPFCNYDQQAGPPPVPPPMIGEDGQVIEPAPAKSPVIQPESWFWGKRVLMVVAVVLVLASTFAVGALVNVVGSRSRLAKQAERQEAERAAREAPAQPVQPGPADSLGNLRLVPVDPSAPVGESITSIPLPDPDQNIPQELQRSDATAIPSEEYARILAQAQPTPTPTGAVVDPRTLPGGIEEIRRAEQARRLQQERDRQAAAAARAAEQSGDSGPEPADADARTTNPVPIHQPLPEIDQTKIREDGTMRFNLKIGADGRVKEVRIIESMPELTARTVAAIQRWRFKPATRNGEPVEGNFQVDIAYNAPQ